MLPAPATASLLSMSDVHITYQAETQPVPAVRGVSLDVPAGTSLGLAGESGCGKTTLASAILRLLPADTRYEGEILLDGKDVLTMRPGELRAVRWTKAAVVFQGALHALNPVQRIGRQIAEPILLHGTEVTEKAARKRVADLLEQVGIPPARADDYAHELSGGQRQRVLIAMALACVQTRGWIEVKQRDVRLLDTPALQQAVQAEMPC